MTARTYGTCVYLPGGDPQCRSFWAVECEPHVSLKLKRCFAKIRPGSMGEHHLSDTAEVARDLEWFQIRWPLAMSDEDRATLTARAQGHRESETITAKLLGKHVAPPAYEMAVPPRDYQRVAASLAIHKGGLLLTDDLGLGKTASSLCVLAAGHLPAIVVTVTSLPRQWQEEANKFTPWLRTHILKKGTPYDLTDGGKEPFPDVIITSYSKIARWAETLAPLLKTSIFDEAQELRLPGTQKYGAAVHLARASEIVMGLTGTPIYNYGVEIFHVLNVICPEMLGTLGEFVQEWCRALDSHDRARIINPTAFCAYLKDQGIMLRRTRAEVGCELPPHTRVPHLVDCDPAALEQVSAGCAALAKFLLGLGASPIAAGEDGGKSMRLRASQELSASLRQATGIAKAPYVAQFVRMLVESGEKVVLYGWHRAVYDIWMEQLAQFNPVMFTGSETVKEKLASFDAFTKGDSKVLIISLRAGSGLDGLQFCGCRTVVFGELDWSYGVHLQDEGRVSRPGQTEPTVAYYLYAEDGSDPVVMDVLGVKRQQLLGVRDGVVTQDDAKLVEQLTVDPERVHHLAQAYLAQRGLLPAA